MEKNAGAYLLQEVAHSAHMVGMGVSKNHGVNVLYAETLCRHEILDLLVGLFLAATHIHQDSPVIITNKQYICGGRPNSLFYLEKMHTFRQHNAPPLIFDAIS
jgi:hypothetical protein